MQAPAPLLLRLAGTCCPTYAARPASSKCSSNLTILPRRPLTIMDLPTDSGSTRIRPGCSGRVQGQIRPEPDPIGALTRISVSIRIL